VQIWFDFFSEFVEGNVIESKRDRIFAAVTGNMKVAQIGIIKTLEDFERRFLPRSDVPIFCFLATQNQDVTKDAPLKSLLEFILRIQRFNYEYTCSSARHESLLLNSEPTVRCQGRAEKSLYQTTEIVPTFTFITSAI
jgi:hypothetical protein